MGEELINYFGGDELAMSAWLSKYALKDKQGNLLESTPDDMHRRLAKEIFRIEDRYNRALDRTYLLSDLSNLGYNMITSDLMTEERIYSLLKNFKYIIPGGSVMSMLGNPYQIGSLSNCFVIGAASDSYGSIMMKRTEQVQLMKRRGGVGKDLSYLRPAGSAVNNAALTSTGPVSFMNVDSELTREVAQGGRRGALMLSIDITHPDSPKFIVEKQDLKKVTGANISVKIPDSFMEAVKADEDYILHYPVDNPHVAVDNTQYEYNQTYKGVDCIGNDIYFCKVKAKELWNTLIHCAWNTAEPGIMFSDKHHGYSPDGVYPEFKGVTTNPCGEIFMQPYDSCRLIHINLTSFVKNRHTQNAYFDFDELEKISYMAMIIADDLIDLEIEAIDKILEHIKASTIVDELEYALWENIKNAAIRGRRAGLGFTGLADVMAMGGIPFCSDACNHFVDLIMYHKFKGELKATIDLAIMRGPFLGYDKEKEYHFEQNDNGDGYYGNNDFYRFLASKYPKELERMINHGRRNVSWSTVAPTGTVSILTQTSSGIEPLFMAYYERSKKCMSPEDRVDFTDATGEKFTKFFVLHKPFKDWINITYPELDVNKLNNNELKELFEKSPWYGSTANEIDWEKRVDLQAIVQKYTTHSISSTVNLPKETTEELISQIYMRAWERGLKGITVYRDGSRDGILNSVDKAEESAVVIVENSAPRRPKTLPADLHVVSSAGIKYAVVVGLMDGKPYEVFAFEFNPLFLSNVAPFKGTITKVKKGVYKFDSQHVSFGNLQLKNGKIEEKACTLYVSMLLRHGASIPFIVKTTRKVNENIVSFSSALSRVLSKYITKAEVKGEVCPDCGAPMVREAGCTKCSQCSYSVCMFIHKIKN